jgi:protease I
MKSALMVIAQEIFRDEEYAEPKRVLESRGIEVTTASVEAGEAIGKLGMRAHADISLSDARSTGWDAVLFVGGAGASVFFDDPAAHDLARQTLENGAVLGAICIAPSTLAHAGLLKGVHATAFASQEADVRAHGALWTGEPVTIDGLIVTANGPEAAERFGLKVAELLEAQG